MMIRSNENCNPIWFNGKIVPWYEAHIHVTSETALRGLNVFEGLRAYWHLDKQLFSVIGIDAHLMRLEESAKTLAIPVHNVTTKFREGIIALLKSISKPANLYVRPTIYIDSGAYEISASKITSGEFISWRYVSTSTHRDIGCCISKWRRIPQTCLPPSAKVGATYTLFRLARIEARRQGFDEAILLNEGGRVSETGGGSVFIVKNGVVITPPLEEGILASITRRIVLDVICPEFSIETAVCPIHTSDLLKADEAFIAGTLDEISRIVLIGKKEIQYNSSESITKKIQKGYELLCAGRKFEEYGWVTFVRIGDHE